MNGREKGAYTVAQWFRERPKWFSSSCKDPSSVLIIQVRLSCNYHSSPGWVRVSGLYRHLHSCAHTQTNARARAHTPARYLTTQAWQAPLRGAITAWRNGRGGVKRRSEEEEQRAKRRSEEEERSTVVSVLWREAELWMRWWWGSRLIPVACAVTRGHVMSGPTLLLRSMALPY